jgi:hypothetical protein
MRRMRRRILIGIVAAASLGGSLSAHLAGALTRSEAPDADGAGRAASGLVPVVLATVFVVLLVVSLSRRLPGRAVAGLTCAAPFVAFALQERLERLLSTESSPFGSGREPGLISAAIALLPWAVAVFLVVRVFVALARVVRTSAAPSIMLVPPAVGPELAPTEVRTPRELHDPVLDRPPRAPPRPRRLAPA